MIGMAPLVENEAGGDEQLATQPDGAHGGAKGTRELIHRHSPDRDVSRCVQTPRRRWITRLSSHRLLFKPLHCRWNPSPHRGSSDRKARRVRVHFRYGFRTLRGASFFTGYERCALAIGPVHHSEAVGLMSQPFEDPLRDPTAPSSSTTA